VICESGSPVWRHVDTAKLTMRVFSDSFLDSYLDAEWPAIGHCVGGYRLEGPGVQLFSKIEGSHFTIFGLPLLPLLDYLRIRGIMTS
jgi:septum formation protein